MRTEHVEYYDNGQVKFRGAEVEGKPDGLWQFYRRDGSLMREGHFEAGEQVGGWTTHDREGRVVRVTAFPVRERSGGDCPERHAV